MAAHLNGVRWYDGLPAVTCEVACEGRRHEISWRRGKLVLEDHDLLAERSLRALGSKAPLCVQVLDAWGRMRKVDMLNPFLLQDRSLSPELLAYRRSRYEEEIESGRSNAAILTSGRGRHLVGAARQSVERHIAQGLEREHRIWELALVESLPAKLRRMLALSVIVKAARSWHREDYRLDHSDHVAPALTAIVLPLFEQSVRRWRRNLKPYASFVVDSDVLPSGEEPGLTARAGTDGASVELALPISWFTDVWAPGIALVDGCFVLGRTGGARGAQTFPVVAVRWERTALHLSKAVPAPAMVTQGRNRAWSLQWL